MTSCSTNTCGVGSWNGPLPGDPDNNSVLTATPAFGGIDVSWSYPAVNPYAVAHTLLYRGVSSDFNTALLISAVGGSFFYDKSTSPQLIQYYYWIRIVSVNGTVGALIGPASAIAKPTIASVIEGLTGQINAGLLAQSLKTEIDKVTLNEQAITEERVARIAANTAYSSVLLQVQAGVDEAYAVITQEITARQDGESALAAAINTTQSVLGNNIASAQTTLQTNINTVDGKVTEIGALYTAKVSVNGLIGGFGIYNNGSVIQAGFDVDEFWVGSSQANKRKPFIIVDGTTYIDDAAINKLTFTKLRDESGAVVIEDGKIKANFLQVNEIAGGAYTGYAWPTSGTGFYLGPGGLLLGNFNLGKYFQVTEEGNIYTPKMNVVNGDIFFSGNVISTGNITNEAVNIFKLARGASLPDYVRTYKGGVTPSVPVNTWMALQLDAGSLNNKLGANNYDAYRTLLPAGTYFYELSVPVKNNSSDTNDAAYTAIISNPPGTPSGTTETVCGNVSVWVGTGKDGYWSTEYQCWQEYRPTSYTVLSTAGVNVVGDWQTATIFGVGRFTLTNPTYVSAAVLTTDAAPALQVVSRSGYSSTILRIWRDTSA